MLSIEDNKTKWDFFQKHHWVSPEFARSHVLESWERCIKQCSPYTWSKPHLASGYTFASLMRRNERLIQCATTVLEDTYDMLDDDTLLLMVTDDNGCILSLVGHSQLKEEMDALGIKQGCFLSEGKIGTNATNLCVHTHVACDVFAAEHFNRHLHAYASAAAPIFDQFGKLRGTACLFKKADAYRKENLVIIASCAKEVSLQIHIQSEQENTNRLTCAHNATLESMDDGLIAWDEEQHITMANNQAERLLNLDMAKVLDKELFSVLRFAPNIVSSIEAGAQINRKLTTLEVHGEFVEAIITLRPLNDGSSLLFLHPIDKIRELAQQQIGGQARYTFSSLPVVSRKMKHLITVAKRATKSKSPILITGEEGVGKATLAMAIHNESDYKEGPFITLNCRSLTSEQQIRETLGYDEGQGMPSKFELAHGGTLFLEKVEYLSPDLQSVLLKLLKTGLVSRSDSLRLIPVDFQLITSTASEISEYVTQRSFGRQLYYEISANELRIPPLRTRKEDIEFLVQQIVNHYERRHNVTISVEKLAMDALMSFRWPGNNSELRNRTERMLLNRSANLIRLSDIPEDIKFNLNQSTDNQPVLSLEEVEKKAIIQAWTLCDGKLNEMAKALKIGRTTLWRKINKFELTEQLKLSS
ncbi:PTS-dependent dihydroxyacetone kinase operon transcriptional regulator DhaR [Vibrio sp. Vb2880]|uniref:dihydroxyacetone kinase operon transcriptional regulator DhaR n=1 Tax=Vibrio TaxID=662 RepID=UPI0012AEB139|nr:MULTISPECIES: dihydroxyacetone kinase operon transcriptional regulator DhaR [Vibrio]MBO0213215.1 PTS-dependent dihydroxyacetone kinase operon transcriptional regulator DhaR [Vibrio sp. Vb2880]MCG6210526.1 PTS-dependent dihydroxyacetone kinase operon transcriptional regulator DhaR [Vibrio furnissii]MCG6217641.1 PTS-dependent dihydroxyacetone kinase operon transcriptional regulator DhaR [Vibrio furnissii]MCG6230873.1 PTS-dependent dihydroxyacetone kinase operon transcriptional regulator DhaR [